MKYKYHKHYSPFEICRMSKNEFEMFNSCLRVGALRLMGIPYEDGWCIKNNIENGGIDIYYS